MSNERQILDQLELLGGKQTKHDDIVFEGTKYIIPAAMTPKKALKFLNDWIVNQEESHMFRRVFKYRWQDVTHATYQVLRELYGGVVGVATQTMFGPIPPRFMDIEIGVGKTFQIPIGEVSFPLVSGTIDIGATMDEDFGQIGMLTANCPKKYKHAIEGLFMAIQNYLEHDSIYRGKAVMGEDNLSFLDLSGVDPNNVIYTDHVQMQLEANVWALLRYTEKMREWNSH